MRQKTGTYVAVAVILIGVLLFVANLTQTRIGPYLWPTALIAIGVWLILRPRVARHTRTRTWRLLGNVHRSGRWHVVDEDIWNVIGDVGLDLREAEIPPGKTTINVHGFVGDVNIKVPSDAGVRVTAESFLTDVNAFGYNQDYILTPYEGETNGYQEAERQVVVTLRFFVGSLNLA